MTVRRMRILVVCKRVLVLAVFWGFLGMFMVTLARSLIHHLLYSWSNILRTTIAASQKTQRLSHNKDV